MKKNTKIFILGIVILLLSTPLGYLIGWNILGEGHSIALAELLFRYMVQSFQLIGVAIIGFSYLKVINR